MELALWYKHYKDGIKSAPTVPESTFTHPTTLPGTARSKKSATHFLTRPLSLPLIFALHNLLCSLRGHMILRSLSLSLSQSIMSPSAFFFSSPSPSPSPVPYPPPVGGTGAYANNFTILVSPLATPHASARNQNRWPSTASLADQYGPQSGKPSASTSVAVSRRRYIPLKARAEMSSQASAGAWLAPAPVRRCWSCACACACAAGSGVLVGSWAGELIGSFSCWMAVSGVADGAASAACPSDGVGGGSGSGGGGGGE
ncbi:hypothetical protein VM1G_11617 [Cytospora mali]|uniref:Uncharacterized protein n=1 Tax=Cytospora mali TaxID=578113 RepID=A0A194VZS8_CYTMA|nr:hypothetical protein VM1G_11617 [Valsa mali]